MLTLYLLLSPFSLFAQNAHYSAGELYIDQSGFMYISTNDTLNLAGSMTTARNMNDAQRGTVLFYDRADWKSGNLSFVDGFVRSYGATAFTFPVGRSHYHPARISATSGTYPTDAAYYSPALHSITALEQGILAVTNESWVIQGSVPAVITLSWNSATNLALVSRIEQIGIAGWNDKLSMWELIESEIDAISLIFGTASSITGTGSVSTVAAIEPGNYAAYTLAITAAEYKVNLEMEGNVGADNAILASHYGKPGDTFEINYVVGTTGSVTNSVAFTGGAVADGGAGVATYTIVAADAVEHIINLTATFTHTDVSSLCGAVNISVNSATGEITAVASGGNTGTSGELQYKWTGGAYGKNPSAMPDLGVPATCEVCATDADGCLYATVTVYKVETALVGNVGIDAASITNPYGKAGETVTINYAIENSGSDANNIAFTGGTVVNGGTSPATYVIAAADATNGIITITATFIHTEIPLLNGGGNHYAEGELFVDRGGFIYISTGDTLHLADIMNTARDATVAQRGMFAFAGSAQWATANESFVDGFVRSNKTSAFIFPVGQSDYRPARISASSSASPTDAAFYTPSLFNTTALEQGIAAVADECWLIQGTVPARITLSWTEKFAGLADELSQLTIVGWDAATNQWVSIESAVDAISCIYGTTSSLSGGSITTLFSIVPNQYAAYTLGITGAVTVPLKLSLFLQGVTTYGKYSFNGENNTGSYMTNNLQDLLLLPETSPYSEASNSYAEINNSCGPAKEVVDWVLVELWETGYVQGETNYDNTVAERRSLLLQIEGSVVDVNGAFPEFKVRNSPCRIVVKHRNHLAVMSAETREFKTGTVEYDFTTDVTQAQNDPMWAPQPQMVMVEGAACLWAGDINMDGAINSSDLSIFRNNSQNSDLKNTYTRADLNMDGYIDIFDHAFIRGRTSLFPFFYK